MNRGKPDRWQGVGGEGGLGRKSEKQPTSPIIT